MFIALDVAGLPTGRTSVDHHTPLRLSAIVSNGDNIELDWTDVDEAYQRVTTCDDLPLRVKPPR